MGTFDIRRGIAPEHIEPAARYLWQAFDSKLSAALGESRRAVAYLQKAMSPANALCAIGQDNTLLGVAGLSTAKAPFFDKGLGALRQVYGSVGCVWRGLLLSVLEHACPPDALHIDCLFVSEQARGLGVGTALLDGVVEKARQEGFVAVSLDVVDTNHAARRLYERVGFAPIRTVSVRPFNRLFGFDTATEMALRLSD